MIITTATPQPFNSNVKSLSNSSPLRNAFEDELWDDNGDVIFAAEDDTLIIPVRVFCRVWITGQADTDTIGAFNILIDGVVNRTVTIIISQTGQIHSYADLSPGNHTITLTADGNLSDPLIIARRGRKPPGV